MTKMTAPDTSSDSRAATAQAGGRLSLRLEGGYRSTAGANSSRTSSAVTAAEANSPSPTTASKSAALDSLSCMTFSSIVPSATRR